MSSEGPEAIALTPRGGLVLDRPSHEVGSDGAIDLLDVDWHRGRLGSREGAQTFSAADGAGFYDRLFPYTVGARETAILLARRGGTLVAIDAGSKKEIEGESKSIGVSESLLSFTKMGLPVGAEFSPVAYIADAKNTIKKFSGNVPAAVKFSSPAATVDEVAGKAMPKGFFLANWQDGGNRLVVAGTTNDGGPAGALGSASHVFFSNPGAPEEFESTAFIALAPGEDEDITGCCVWGGQVFIFKETRLFVVYGISADAEGRPIFNFREVDLGTQITSFRGSGDGKLFERVAAGREGVYFVAADGVYVTTGGEPALLSSDLDPLAGFGDVPASAAESLPSTARWRYATQIAYMNDTLYVVLPDRLLRFDMRGDRWTVYKSALNCVAPWVEQIKLFDNQPRLYFSGSKAKRIFFYTPEEDEDPTVEMEPRYQTGFYDVDNADEKTFVNSKLWGEGEVEVQVAEDFGDLDTGKKFELGSGGAVAQSQKQRGQTATFFSHCFSGDAPWSVNLFARYLRETRVAGTQKP